MEPTDQAPTEETETTGGRCAPGWRRRGRIETFETSTGERPEARVIEIDHKPPPPPPDPPKSKKQIALEAELKTLAEEQRREEREILGRQNRLDAIGVARDRLWGRLRQYQEWLSELDAERLTAELAKADEMALASRGRFSPEVRDRFIRAAVMVVAREALVKIREAEVTRLQAEFDELAAEAEQLEAELVAMGCTEETEAA